MNRKNRPVDQYLVPMQAFNRLLFEYQEHKSIVVAYDFDNTVYDFHKKGHTYEFVIELLQKLKKKGCYLIVFTANEDTEMIKKYLEENDIPYDSINENPPFFKSNSRKIYYNALLDDRAGLMQVYNELNQLLNVI